MTLNLRRSILTAAACLVLVMPVHAALSVSFNGSVVRVSGVTPRGQVALISVMREANAKMITRLNDTQQLLTDSDGDGAVEYDFKKDVPIRSVWAVVDVDSGSSLITAPGEFPTSESLLPAGFVKNAPADEFDTLIGEHMLLHVLWVHPGRGGSGVWFMRSADGGANDKDGKTNGRAVLSTASFLPLGDSGKAPKKLKKGDVLVLLDPFAMSSSRGVISQ